MKFIVHLLTVTVCAFSAEIPIRPVHLAFAKWNQVKIVGGQEAIAHSIPYQVGIFMAGFFCGGSLISPRWVLTAAHCGEITDKPQIILGAHKIKSSESTQIIITGIQVFIHEKWNSETLQNDIALIELPHDVDLTSNVNIVPLAPEDGNDHAGSDAVASGWGLASDDANTISSVLRRIEAKILTNKECASKFGKGILISETIICLDGSQGRSTCSGDSGGPLTVNGVQVGLTSFGVSSGCEDGYPAGFTRVSSFRSWIFLITEI